MLLQTRGKKNLEGETVGRVFPDDNAFVPQLWTWQKLFKKVTVQFNFSSTFTESYRGFAGII